VQSGDEVQDIHRVEFEVVLNVIVVAYRARVDVRRVNRADIPIPFGFDVNFGGASHSGAYLIPAGNLIFAPDSYTFSTSAFESVRSLKTSGISVFGADLMPYFSGADKATSSYIWAAQTTLNGKQAFVVSWERMRNWVSGFNKPYHSFQLVIVNDGGGDFTSWFNYEEVSTDIIGYSSPQFFSNLEAGFIGGNEFRLYTNNGVPQVDLDATCFRSDDGDGRFYSKVLADFESNVRVRNFPGIGSYIITSNSTIKFYVDSSCGTPINGNIFGNYIYLNLEPNLPNIDALLVGWYVWDDRDPLNLKIEITEFYPNQANEDLEDSKSTALKENSLNTDVKGRYIVGMRGGKTTGDPLLSALQSNEENVIPQVSTRNVDSLGNKSITTILLNDLSGIDNNWNDADITLQLLQRVLREIPDSDVAHLADGRKNMTFFMPTDRAFRHFVRELTGMNPGSELNVYNYLMQMSTKSIESVLLHHMVQGDPMYFSDLKNSEKTILGNYADLKLEYRRLNESTIRLIDGNRKFKNATLIYEFSDINDGNKQVVHQIDRVLVGKSKKKLLADFID
jgi:hypothetical protein